MTDHSLPAVPSPYEGRRLRFGDHFHISAYWFATNFLWGALLTVMLPDQARRLAPENKALALGAVFGIGAIMALLVPLIVGPLSDRCASKWGRRRPYMAAGVGINVLGMGLMWLAFEARSLPLFIAAYLVVQAGNNAASAAYSGFIPDLVPEDQRGTASGYMAVMSNFGTLLGAFLVGDFLGSSSTGAQYGVLSLVLVLVAAQTILGVKERPLPERPPRLDWLTHLKRLWIDPKKHPNFAWVWLTRASVMIGFYMVLPFIQYYLDDVVGVTNPAAEAPKLLAIVLIGAAVSGVLGGVISDRIGRKKVVYFSNVVMAVTAVMLAFCRTMPQALAVGVVFGIGYGAYISVDWALGTDVLPNKADAAKDMAVWHISMTLPQSLGAPLGGFLVGAFGKQAVPGPEGLAYHYPVTGYAALFVVAALFFGLGAWGLRHVRGVR